MPPLAHELQLLPPYLALWHAYDRTARVELYSTAIRTGDGLIVIDPTALNRRAFCELDRLGPVTSILLTNVNHERAADSFANNYAAPIFGPKELIDAGNRFRRLAEGALHGLDVIAIDGAAPGEIAIYDPRSRGVLIIGDALINFNPYGFSLLPRKYCTDQKLMIRSLTRLLDLQFEKMLFAHGLPITTRAHDRLTSLLEQTS